MTEAVNRLRAHAVADSLGAGGEREEGREEGRDEGNLDGKRSLGVGGEHVEGEVRDDEDEYMLSDSAGEFGKTSKSQRKTSGGKGKGGNKGRKGKGKAKVNR
jgi:hypothetical protein